MYLITHVKAKQTTLGLLHGSGILWTTPRIYWCCAHLADISPSAAHDELCINLPSGIYLSASFSSFQACSFWLRVSSPQLAAASALGPVMWGPCFSRFLMFSSSRYNNDRKRGITVLMCNAAAGFQHHVSDACSPPGFLRERDTSPFTSTNGTLFMDVTVMWRKPGSQQDVRWGTAA